MITDADNTSSSARRWSPNFVGATSKTGFKYAEASPKLDPSLFSCHENVSSHFAEKKMCMKIMDGLLRDKALLGEEKEKDEKGEKFI